MHSRRSGGKRVGDSAVQADSFPPDSFPPNFRVSFWGFTPGCPRVRGHPAGTRSAVKRSVLRCADLCLVRADGNLPIPCTQEAGPVISPDRVNVLLVHFDRGKVVAEPEVAALANTGR
jgi:hypothetical protein